MANGDLARALAYQSQLPTDARALFRQWMDNVMLSVERDKERAYKDEIRAEESTRYLQDWNRDETRYQDKIRTEREERNEERDKIVIARGLEMNLDERSNYYNKLIDSGRMKSVFGYDLLEGEVNTTRGKLGTANTILQGLDAFNLDPFSYKQIEAQYMAGKFAEGFKTFGDAIDLKVDITKHPQINSQVKIKSAEQLDLAKKMNDQLLSGAYTKDQRDAMFSRYNQLGSEISALVAPLSMYKTGGKGAAVDSTDYGLFQINDKTFDKHSQSFFGKPTQRLSPEENIKFASWIVKNQPRTIGSVTSGWNNWSVFFGKDKRTGEELYKKNLNKSDAYYMAGGLSESNLRLIEREFGKDAPIAKAVMFSESSGKHSSINQNLASGGSRTGKISNNTPFSPGWNADATSHLAATTGLSPKEFLNSYGKELQTWINKMNRQGITGDRANVELEKFASKLKGVAEATPKLQFTVPEGRDRGKQITAPIVKRLLAERERTVQRKAGARPGQYTTKRVGAQSSWLDVFARELGFDTAEDLLTKDGVKAMKDYYSGAMPQAGQIDFTQPYTLTR